MEKENRKLFGFLKWVTIIISLCLLVLSIVFLFIIIFNKKNSGELDWLGKVASISATISIGLLPIYYKLVTHQRYIREKDRVNVQSTSEELNSFSNFLADKHTHFVVNVLKRFNIKYDLERFYNDFFINDYETTVNNMFTAINTIDKDWINTLYQIVMEEKEILGETDMINISKLSAPKVFDTFIWYLLNCLNKAELFCYNFLNLKIDEKTFCEQESLALKRLFFRSYLLLTKTGNNNDFPCMDITSKRIFCKEEK